MKYLLIAIMMFSFGVSAKDVTCKQVGDIADIIMMMRQSGTEMHKLMETGESKVFYNLVIKAYEEPRFDTAKYQRASRKDFANEAMLACYKAKT